MDHNLDILKRMMEDLRRAPTLFQPTNYWRTYEPDIIEYLERNGLKNFRSYDTFRLASFGAGTYRCAPLSDHYKSMLGAPGLAARLVRVVCRAIESVGRRWPILVFFNIVRRLEDEIHYLNEFRELQSSEYRCSKLLDQLSGLSVLDAIEDSCLGNPYDVFQVNKKKYTLSFLKYFNQLAYIATHLDVKRIKVVVELGSGYGGCSEVFVKSLPNVSYFNFDIPPQLYVSQQYLSSAFPGRVYGYEHFLRGEGLDTGRFRVFCLPSWKFGVITESNVDLFINSASFQEMEPEVVENYYRILRHRVQYVYLWQLTYGTYKKTSEASGGCVHPLKAQDYLALFRDFTAIAIDEHYRVENPYTHLLLERV